MIIFIYSLIVFFAVFQSAATKLFTKKSNHSTVFNALRALASFMMFFGMACLKGFDLHIPTLVFGLIYGGCLCLSMYSGYMALCLGKMALTSMLVSFSVIIPLLFGITFGGEKITILQCFAFLFLFSSIILTNFDKIFTKNEEHMEKGKSRNTYPLWILFVALTFISNGACSVLQKEHQTLFPKLYSNEFMLFAMLLCSLIFSIVCISKTGLKETFGSKGKLCGVLSGIANGLASFLTLTLAGFENASVLFPIISVGTLLGALLCGRLVFGEKLKPNHYLAIALGAAAVVLLKL
jgi:drug/metabolite transporter (DMT)-like permease